MSTHRSGQTGKSSIVPLSTVATAAFIQVLVALTCTMRSEATTLKASGHIEGQEVHIASLVPGRVISVNTADGGRITRGQVLFKLDDAEARIKLQGSQRVLSSLNKEQAQLHKLLDILNEQMSRQLHMLDGVGNTKTGAKGFAPKDPVLTDGSKSSVTNSSAGADVLEQQTNLIDRLRQSQLDGLAQAESSEKDMLAQSEKTQRQALEEVFKTKRDALDDAIKLRKAANKPSWLTRIFAPKLVKTRQAAIEDVARSKRQAIDDSKKAALQSLDAAIAAESAAITQAFATKRAAINDAFQAQQSAVKQIADTTAKLQKEAGVKQAAVESQIKRYQASIQKLAAGAGSGGGTMMSGALLKAIQAQIADVHARVTDVDVEIAKAQTARDEVRSKLKDFSISSPIDGVCETCNISAGEICLPSQTLATVVDPSRLYLRVFVAEGQIGRVRVGQQAKVFLDGVSGPPLEARVVSIDAQASFTPESVTLPEDRVRQVFGVRLQISQPGGAAKAGMPADAEIAVN